MTSGVSREVLKIYDNSSIGWLLSSESWDWVVGEFRELVLGGCLVQRVGIGWLVSSESWYWVVA